MIYVPAVQLHQEVNGKSSFLCDFYQSKVIFQSRNRLYRYKEFLPCLAHQTLLCGCIFCTNNGKLFISSVASGHGREAPGGQEIFRRRLQSTQMELRLSTECLCSSVCQAFPGFYLLCHCMEIFIFFSSIFSQKMLLYRFVVVKWYHIESLQMSPYRSCLVSSTMYRNMHLIVF